VTAPGGSGQPEAGAPAGRNHAPFFGVLLGLLVGAAAVWALLQFGELNDKRTNFVFRPLLAGLLSLAALWCVVYGLWRGPLGWKLGLPLLLVVYLGIERFTPPAFSRVYGLKTWIALQDPDHRPQHTDKKKGWNSDSLRCPHQPGEFRAKDTNVVFLGDSFTFGMLLEPEETFPALVERRLQNRFPERDLKVANFGWVSSSPLLSLRRLEEIGDKYSPDLVVLCLDMTDIRDDIRWEAMLEERGAYRLVQHFPLTMKTLKKFVRPAFDAIFARLNPDLPQRRFFMTEAPLEETRDSFAKVEHNIGRIHAWCEERGLPFVLVVLPRSFQYSDRECPNNWEVGEYVPLGPYVLEPFRYFEEMAGRVDYPVHSLLETFQQTEVFPTCFDHDPHWNPDGAEIAAKAITRLLVPEVRSL